MIVIPAIDVLDGKAVRLKAGRREDVTVYSDAPWEVAAGFVRSGAQHIHVVDLGGAFGTTQGDVVARVVAAAAPALVEAGGGLRTVEDAERLLTGGVGLVVLGTAAVRTPDVVKTLCARHPGRIVVAVDARDGKVAIEGWTETSSTDALSLARWAADWGAARILYTDVARDGLRTGPAVEVTARMQELLGALPVIASGGISSLDDLRALDGAGVKMCVVGRALYEGVFTLEEALAAC
jgi:phosphoribosylformimino-5-aminoimidazole carboxamide ribotide isomerase